jgi:hypothetical protein
VESQENRQNHAKTAKDCWLQGKLIVKKKKERKVIYLYFMYLRQLHTFVVTVGINE